MTPHRWLCVLLVVGVVTACGSRSSPGALQAEPLGIADDEGVAIGLDAPGRGSAFVGCDRQAGMLHVSIAVLAEGRELSIDDRSVRLDGHAWPKVVTLRIDDHSFDLGSARARSVAEGNGFRVTLLAEVADVAVREALVSGELIEVGAFGTTLGARFSPELMKPVREICVSATAHRSPTGRTAPTSTPRAAARADNVTGPWRARYFEGDGPGIPFEVVLTEFDGVVTGAGTEDLRRADGALATHRVQLIGSHDPRGRVEFSKAYQPPIGLRGQLVYEGRVSPAGDAIEGTWTVDGRRGTFVMARLAE